MMTAPETLLWLLLLLLYHYTTCGIVIIEHEFEEYLLVQTD